MNKLFHALVLPLASDAFLSSSLFFLKDFDLWSSKIFSLFSEQHSPLNILIRVGRKENSNSIQNWAVQSQRAYTNGTYSGFSNVFLSWAGMTCNNRPWKIELSNSSSALQLQYNWKFLLIGPIVSRMYKKWQHRQAYCCILFEVKIWSSKENLQLFPIDL